MLQREGEFFSLGEYCLGVMVFVWGVKGESEGLGK